MWLNVALQFAKGFHLIKFSKRFLLYTSAIISFTIRTFFWLEIVIYSKYDMWDVHMHRNPETLTTFFCSGSKRLLTFFFTFSFFDTRRERHNFYYADRSIWPNSVRCIPEPQLDSPRPDSNLNWPRPASDLN